VSKAKSDKVSPDLDTPSDIPQAAVDKISVALNTLLADAFALYLKTKNFHWHVSGRHFRDYHLMLDEQSEAIFATTDQLAERVRKLGGATLRSIGQVSKLQTIQDNNESYVPPREMLRELMEDNKHVAAAMRKAHKLCDDHEDSGTAGLLETFIDETERRTWFLFEGTRKRTLEVLRSGESCRGRTRARGSGLVCVPGLVGDTGWIRITHF
jgi:starvation-inducible DNA-binding protein